MKFIKLFEDFDGFEEDDWDEEEEQPFQIGDIIRVKKNPTKFWRGGGNLGGVDKWMNFNNSLFNNPIKDIKHTSKMESKPTDYTGYMILFGKNTFGKGLWFKINDIELYNPNLRYLYRREEEQNNPPNWNHQIRRPY